MNKENQPALTPEAEKAAAELLKKLRKGGTGRRAKKNERDLGPQTTTPKK